MGRGYRPAFRAGPWVCPGVRGQWGGVWKSSTALTAGNREGQWW
jgi:hypothetical protein